MTPILEDKIRPAWANFTTFAKIFILSVLTISVFLTVTNLALFRIYYSSLTESVLGEIRYTMDVAASDMDRRVSTAESTLTQLAKLISIVHDQDDFNAIVSDSFISELGHHPLFSQIAYIPIDGSEFLYENRNKPLTIDGYDMSFVADAVSSKPEKVVFSDITPITGDINLGTPAFDESGNIIGIVVVTGNLNNIFAEIEELTIHSVTYRAIIDSEGNYLWRHENFKDLYGTGSTKITEDIRNFPERAYTGVTDAIKYRNDVISFASFGAADPEARWVLVQVADVNSVIQPAQSLRDALMCISMGYLGIQGLLLIFVSSIVGVEINLRKKKLSKQLKSKK